MKFSLTVASAMLAFISVTIASPILMPESLIERTFDKPDKQKPYKTEVDAQAAKPAGEKRKFDKPDKQKPYKTEVDAQAAKMAGEKRKFDKPDKQKPYKTEVDAQAAKMAKGS